MKSIKLRNSYQEFGNLELVIRILVEGAICAYLSNPKFLIPQKNYFIKNGILAMFFNAIPVPRTTARSGSSATCTGSFIL